MRLHVKSVDVEGAQRAAERASAAALGVTAENV